MEIHVLIENTTRNTLYAEHGLSFFIAFEGKHYLLDSGQSGAFIDNAKQLSLSLEHIDYAILSHGHYDHSDGFVRFLDMYPNVPVYASHTYDQDYYSTSGGQLHYIGVHKDVKGHPNFKRIQTLYKLVEHVYLLPHQSRYGKTNLYKKEQDAYYFDCFDHELSLIFETQKGLVLFNSCTHNGIFHVLEDVQKAFPSQPVYAYIGGLHLKGKQDGKEICILNEEEIQSICEMLKQKEIMHLYTGHCTGRVAYKLLQTYGKERIHSLYSGKQIKIYEVEDEI